MHNNLEKINTKGKSECNQSKMKQGNERKQRNTRNKRNFQRKINKKLIIHPALQKLQAPIFNIHIHVPAYKSYDLKMLLPKIQPVVHLHFDKLEWRLKSNKKQSGETSSKMFEKLLSGTLPKFGDVKLHFDNTLKKNDDVSISELSERAHCSSTDYFDDDPEKESYTMTESYGKNISETKESEDMCASDNSSQNFTSNLGNPSNFKDSFSSDLSEDFKLKKAVVVLNDISKTTYYKNVFAVNNSGIVENNKNKSSATLVNKSKSRERVSINEEFVNDPIKVEEESLGCDFLTADSESENESIPVDPVHTLSGISYDKTESIAHDSFDNSLASNPEVALSALGEGCSFSEIISRFQLKKKREFIEESECSTSKIDNSGAFPEQHGCTSEFPGKIQQKEVVEQLIFGRNQ